MVAIYSFKKFDGHYKPINDDFLRLAKLSVKSAKKYYKTRFYSDQESFDFFTENGIIFDEFVWIFSRQYIWQTNYQTFYASRQTWSF